ncbi:Carboxylesterase [Thalictrum thalictroides]|uniref:Carboxylesterase n=1 Tax=Thalictrum thalictroides TaxID=46969 RepID=A0A7J6W5P9_THATH|nr:Carboxylesterase [Thalictrum thalictroides]
MVSAKRFKEIEERSIIDPYKHLRISLNEDGTLTRSGFPTAPVTSEDEFVQGETHVSKDVTLNTDNKTWMRIFRPTKLPSNDMNIAKLPIILYFHPGGFILHNADTVYFHESCGRYSSEVPSIVISVDYRIAPENRLPAAYEDAKEALFWIKKQAMDPNGDQWLRDYADFSRCHIMGCDCGANIAYRTGLVAMELDLEPVKIVALILNQPLFGGTEITRSELIFANDDIIPKSVLDLVWELALPVGSNRDHEYSNPMVEKTYQKNIRLLPRTLIRGFSGNVMYDRQMEFIKMLMKNGVQITAHFGEIGFHMADIVDARRHLAFIKYLKDFI